MIIAYKFKLKPNKSQKALMVQWLDMLRSHYNFCLRDRIESYEQVRQPKLGNYCDLKTKTECCPLTCSVSKNSSIGEHFKGDKKRNAYEQQSSELPKLKKTRTWYKSIHSTVLQQNLRKLDTAFKNFFEGKGYPKFKARHRFKSFNYPPNQVKLKGNKIYLPSLGWMRFYQSRQIPNGFNLRSITVRQKADGWYVAIQIEDQTIPQSQPKDLEQVKSVIGVDLGIKKLLALSNGEQIKNPQFEKQLERNKTIRQRRASRKKKASKNQKKACQKLARIDQKIVNQRTNYQWKIANHLVRLAEVIVLENLNIKGMSKRCQPKPDENGKYLKNNQSAKRALNRLIRDCSWGELKLKIQSVAEKFGCIVIEVNPRFTSQECSVCGQIDKANRKGEKFVCTNCGHLADADNQAAINIGKKGIEILNLSLSKLLRVTQKVTAKPELTGLTRKSLETSISLDVEPSNPQQLNLFEWMDGQVTDCSKSPVTPLVG
jgi:putative transposase